MNKKLKEFEEKAIKLVRNHNKSSSKLRDKIKEEIEEKAGDK